MKLYFDEAFAFFQKHINRSEFFRLLKEHNLKTSGSVPSIAWELFGSILTGKNGSAGYGADLDGVEIKSAILGSSFEYQYHLHAGLLKLEEDQTVDHFFCSYAPDYQSFQVYFIPGSVLSAEYFRKWIPLYKKNYGRGDNAIAIPASERRQRFRKSISYGFVVKNGALVMDVQNGELIASTPLPRP